jgi:hypothetical protein
MKHVLHAFIGFAFVLAVCAPARADDAADAKAIVEKAIKAQGGQEKLEKLSAQVIKFKGKFHGMGQPIDMTGEVSTQGFDKSKLDVEVDVGGKKFRFINVLNGDKAWTRMSDKTSEMGKDELAEAKEQAYAAWAAKLTPLKDKQFTLATIGEVMIEKQATLGVKVSSKGHRDIDMYFDKETGLLVKTETRVKADGSDMEVQEESFASDYKEVQGTKQAMKFTVKRDGKLFVEGEATELTLEEKLDASIFAKP